MSGPLNISQLVQAGCGVGELRKLGVSPAEIRAAGFTLQQMHVHLGVERLCEAGFTLNDFQQAHFPLNEVVRKFSLNQLLSSGAYALSELMGHFSGSELRSTGRFNIADFVALGNMSGSDLRQFGFSEAEIKACGINIPKPTPAAPSALQPPHAATMNVGDSWSNERHGDASTFLKITYRRVSESEARQLLSHPHPENRASSGSSYDGSGKHCPRCGCLFVLLTKRTSSDGMCGVESGSWVCDDPACGMRKEESYEGYGSIF